jgi:DNA repair protein RadD
VLTEGFDCPAAEVCILARPTQSLTLHLQMIGRVLRPNDGKDRALIHDHAGNLMRHGFPDDDRDYSLTVSPKRARELHSCPFCCVVFGSVRPDGTCPRCGELIAQQIEALRSQLSRPDLTDAEAQRVGTASPRQKAAEFLRLRQLAERKGWAVSWAEKKYRETFGISPGFSDEFLAHVRPAPRPFVTPRKHAEVTDAA